MPGVVPRTSTQALCNATLPYISAIARYGAVEATERDRFLAGGLNTYQGHITHKALREASGLPVADFAGMSRGEPCPRHNGFAIAWGQTFL